MAPRPPKTSGTRAQPPVDPRPLAAAAPGARLTMLGSSLDGLSTEAAASRLLAAGLNEPVRPTASHPARAFAAQFTHTLALLLWFAAGLAFAARIPELGGAIVAVVVVNGVFAFVQEYRAEQVVASLMRRVAVEARVVRGGLTETLKAVMLVPGDVVLLAPGEIVPADCVLLHSENLSVDLSMLTGETTPAERSHEPSLVPPGKLQMSDVPSLLPAGAGVVGGMGTAVVYATGRSSSIGAVAGLVQDVHRTASILERQVAALSRLTGAVAVLSGAATLGLVAAFTPTTFVAALTFGTGVIVALVPEGLLPTLSVSLAIGASRMAVRGAAVRRLSAVEVVGSVTVICSDKTGTLTENALTVTGVMTAGGESAPNPDILLAAVLCNDAVTQNGAVTGDPLDVALWRWAAAQSLDPAATRQAHPRLQSIPFDARTRYMSVTCSVGGLRRVCVKGAPEAVLPLTGETALPPDLARGVDEATGRGDRVLLLATAEEGSPFALALVRFADPPRQRVPAAIAACRKAGVRVVMLTGDHPDTARAVARAIHLADDDIPLVRGDEVDAMSDAALREFLSRNVVVARVDPQQKLRIVRALQAAGEVVVVTGDGINDAPALRAADVGVAMGLRGTEVAKQAADIVLADDNFATIVAAIEEGRSIRANIRRFISYVFTSNVAEMAPFVVYIFLPVPLPLAVIQALAVDVGTDLLPALALGAEPASPDMMETAPESSSHPLLTPALGLRTFLFYGVVEAALGLAGFFAFYLAHGWRVGDSFGPFQQISHQAATVTFLGIVGGQVGCLFAQRDGSLARRLSLRGNRLVPFSLTFELGLAAVLVYVPGINHVFSMNAVAPQWLLAVPLAATVFIAVDQIRRIVSRDPGVPPGTPREPPARPSTSQAPGSNGADGLAKT
ncbi:MAG: cation-transporting P-type ATPase [Chloroflexi bacterium]|nr:cation-transporting P-type ATPase [Chloroflexota bacterium]